MTEGTVRYIQEHGNWFVTMAGDIRYSLGPAIHALLERAFAEEDESHFVIDMSQIEGIDSTCLGILARIIDHPSKNSIRPIIITGGNDIHELLLAVCFDRMFDLVESIDETITAQQLQPIPTVAVDQENMLILLLEAH